MQNFIQGVGLDKVVHTQARLFLTLVCQLQSVWLDKTPMNLADLRSWESVDSWDMASFVV